MLIMLDVNWIKLAGSGVQWWRFLVTMDLRIPWQHGINVRFGVLTAGSVGAVMLGLEGRWRLQVSPKYWYLYQTTRRHIPGNWNAKMEVMVSFVSICRPPKTLV